MGVNKKGGGKKWRKSPLTAAAGRDKKMLKSFWAVVLLSASVERCFECRIFFCNFKLVLLYMFFISYNTSPETEGQQIVSNL